MNPYVTCYGISIDESCYLNQTKADQDACQQRSAVMWDCTARKKSENGYIYEFKLKSEFNHINIYDNSINETAYNKFNETNKKIYPAIEPDTGYVSLLAHPQLRKLGYEYIVDYYDGKHTIQLPDREALLNAYEVLKKNNIDLPDLIIHSVAGVSNDLDFSKKNCTGTVLSEEEEFIHDHFFHLIPRLMRIFEGLDSYAKTEQKIVHTIDLTLLKIKWVLSDSVQSEKITKTFKQNEKNIEKMYAVLGMITDALSSFDSEVINELNLGYEYPTIFLKDLQKNGWEPYLIKRFNEPDIVQSIQNLWSLVEEVCSQ